MIDTYARKYVEPAIQRTARAFLDVRLSPNQATWAAFVIGVGAAVLAYLQHTAVAVVVLWVSGYLDAVDGAMARQSGRQSAWGTLLDITFDRIVEVGVIIALALRYPGARLILVVLTAGIIFSMTVFLTVGALSDKAGIKSFYYQAGLAERTEGFIFLSLMVLLPQWLVWTAAVFVAVEVITGCQRLIEGRRLLA